MWIIYVDMPHYSIHFLLLCYYFPYLSITYRNGWTKRASIDIKGSRWCNSSYWPGVLMIRKTRWGAGGNLLSGRFGHRLRTLFRRNQDSDESRYQIWLQIRGASVGFRMLSTVGKHSRHGIDSSIRTLYYGAYRSESLVEQKANDCISGEQL